MKIATMVTSVFFAMLVGSSAFAKGLEGHYTLSIPCQGSFELNGPKKFSIPAGKIKILENVPIEEDITGVDHPAIIIQAEDDYESVLTLGIGKFTPFFMYSTEFSMGTYSADRQTFLEQYSPGDSISLERTSTHLVLRLSSQSGSQTTCTFVSAD